MMLPLGVIDLVRPYMTKNCETIAFQLRLNLRFS